MRLVYSIVSWPTKTRWEPSRYWARRGDPGSLLEDRACLEADLDYGTRATRNDAALELLMIRRYL